MSLIVYIGVVIVAFLLAVFLFWRVVFLRNPSRTAPGGNNIVSPADGKVLDVIPFTKNSVTLFKGNHRLLGIIKTITHDIAPDGYIVSIFMSPLNVHYNRAPVAGKILSVVQTPGKFLPVNTVQAGLVNEKSEIIIENAHGRFKMIQIAGFLAKRIETYVKPGDVVKKGELVGLINLGSQVTMIIPKSVSVQVNKGDHVTAGETILAEINN